MEKVDFINKSLLLRYEAFSKFATEVNQSNTFDDLGVAISSHVKFIFDAFIVRILFATAEEKLSLECFRGTYQFNFNNDVSTDLDQKYLRNEIPCILTQKEIKENQYLRKSIFAHPKVIHLFVLPLQCSPERKVLLQVGSKNELPFSEVDFRFIRLFGEFLTTKLSQLFLGKKIIAKNSALEDANEKLILLNQQVKNLNNSLESLVAQRTASLTEAQKELNTLFYRTSHDFRRPLSSMLGLSNLIECTSDKDEILCLLHLQKKSLRELNTMLDKLQTISLTDTDNALTEEINLKTILTALEKKFVPALQDTGVHFSYTINTKRKIYAHSAMLSAILENLIENAIQYRTSLNPFVKVTISRKKTETILVVKDNGEGIPLQYQPLIYDMYFRANERATGNGLGLYIVKKLVDKFGGSITCRSDIATGSSFQVTIPTPCEKALEW